VTFANLLAKGTNSTGHIITKLLEENGSRKKGTS
jgi:hypothetical protein